MVKKFILNLKLPLQGNSLKSLSQVVSWQRLNQNQLLELQQERLKRLLVHAYKQVPYYRNILREAEVVTDNEEIMLDNFHKIPLLTKDIIRSKFQNLKSNDINNRKWYENTSGGSTGEPVRFVQEKHYGAWPRAVTKLYDIWTGYYDGQRKVILWGSERDLFVGHETLKIRLGRWLRNELWLNSFRMTPEHMISYVEKINKFKPIQILAYAESIYELSRFIENEGLKVYSPKAIMTTADMLYPHMRETIEKVFRSPVFNRYGSREVGIIACECEKHEGLHVFSPIIHVEILKQDCIPTSVGEMGEVVITSMFNYAMPLIRYKIGDTGIWAKNECSCGRKLPLLKQITGRVTDTFYKKDHTQVYGGYFNRLFYFRDWVRKFQVIQEDYDEIRLIIIPQKTSENIRELYYQQLNEITTKIQLVLGKECRVNYEFVTDIPPTASGKYRYTISKVKNK